MVDEDNDTHNALQTRLLANKVSEKTVSELLRVKIEWIDGVGNILCKEPTVELLNQVKTIKAGLDPLYRAYEGSVGKICKNDYGRWLDGTLEGRAALYYPDKAVWDAFETKVNAEVEAGDLPDAPVELENDWQEWLSWVLVRKEGKPHEIVVNYPAKAVPSGKTMPAGSRITPCTVVPLVRDDPSLMIHHDPPATERIIATQAFLDAHIRLKLFVALLIKHRKAGATPSKNEQYARRDLKYELQAHEVHEIPIAYTGDSLCFKREGITLNLSRSIVAGKPTIDAHLPPWIPTKPTSIRLADGVGPFNDEEMESIRSWSSCAYAIILLAKDHKISNDDIKRIHGHWMNTQNLLTPGGIYTPITLSVTQSDHRYPNQVPYMRYTVRDSTKTYSVHVGPDRSLMPSYTELWSKLGRLDNSVDLNMTAMIIIAALARDADPLQIILDAATEDPEADAVAAEADHLRHHTHLSWSDKEACALTYQCHVCLVDFKCSDRLQLIESYLCPTHQALYSMRRRARSPLFNSIYHNIDVSAAEGRNDVAQEMFDLAAFSDEGLRVVVTSITTPGPTAYDDALARIAPASATGVAQYPAYIARNDSNRSFIEHVVHQVYLFPAGVEPPALVGCKWSVVPVYTAEKGGWKSYDDWAVETALRPSVDQSRVLRVSNNELETGHTKEAIDILPWGLNAAKHTFPYEFCDYLAIRRVLHAEVFPILSQLPSDLQDQHHSLEIELNAMGEVFYQINKIIPHSEERRFRYLKDKQLRKKYIHAHADLLNFGKKMGYKDPMYEIVERELGRHDEDLSVSTASTASSSSSNRSPSTVTMAEMAAMDHNEIFEMVLDRKATAYTSKAAAEVNKHPDLLKAVKTKLQSCASSSEDLATLTLIGITSLFCSDYYGLKLYHLWLLLLWCDQYGQIWLEIWLITFIYINSMGLIACRARCEYFGFQLTARSRDLHALADGHVVHGISALWKVQTARKVLSLNDIDLSVVNVKPQSRASNYLYMNFRQAGLRSFDAKFRVAGLEKLRLFNEGFTSALLASPVYQEQLKKVKDHAGVWGVNPLYPLGYSGITPNHYKDLAADHPLNPINGKTHPVYGLRKSTKSG